MKLRFYLMQWMTRMTQHPRYFPTIAWSKTQVVHNVFRAYEYFFGRPFGPNGVGDTIRKEVEVHDRYVEGVVVDRKFVYHTLEARLAQHEQSIKDFLWSNKYIVAMFVASMFVGNPMPLIMAAIGFGAISAVTNATPITSVAVSGSDTLGIVCVAGESTDLITAITWNSVSMTKIGAVLCPSDRYASAWWVANPASSSSIAFTGGTYWRASSMYYTGCAQTGQPDSFNTGTVSGTAAISVATTVVASNCWMVMFIKNGTGGGAYTPSNAMAIMRLQGDAAGNQIADSDGTVGTGSQTATVTKTDAPTNPNQGAIAFSIKPVATTTIKTWDGITRANLKTLDGVASASIKTINGIT